MRGAEWMAPGLQVVRSRFCQRTIPLAERGSLRKRATAKLLPGASQGWTDGVLGDPEM